ncbi:structural maintenance of chromosomes protein 2 isoform X2 [Quercus lobata]|uniref:structural maintenance of chromosomes protein 2 isoform X2 n=1 Tax=Quercus lobata TaxID=97700 RepID=UPI001243ADB7|nr:structural maintenance of chromosomes protein 2 isoform X2 [Quercus lobata]
MTRLSSEQVLKESETSDPNSVTSLKLSCKALSDVSCLSDFTNLERLDLSFNNLTSLQNKLESLNGIEALSKLTVLNAGKNKLRSMDEIKSLVSLRALILNDNEIISICKLDQISDLNTLVLSRNPICEIGESLVKVKSITKLSFSNCQLHTIGSSLKYCTELKELRLSHNSIRTLPAELARNKKLQNLDLGNNAIIRWSDLEVLASLVNLKNLNLQGNPVAEKGKLAKKIKEVLPNLKIFNTKPADKYTNNSDGIDKVDDSYVNSTNKVEVQKDKKRDDFMKNSKHHVMAQSKDGPIDNAEGIHVEKLKRKRQKTSDNVSENVVSFHGDEKRGDIKKMNSKYHLKDLGEDSPLDNAIGVDVEKKLKKKRSKTNDISSEKETPVFEDERRDDIKKNNSEHHVVELSKDNAKDVHVERESRHKKQKNDKLSKKQVPVHEEVDAKVEKKLKKTNARQGALDVIDDPEASFMEIFAPDNAENPKYDDKKKIANKAIKDMKTLDGLVSISVKKKRAKSHGVDPAPHISPTLEIGLGGPSTWGDE